MSSQISGISKRDEAAQFLRLVLPLMSKHSVPVTPPNYAVWYEYVSGGNEALRATMDSLLAQGQALNEEAVADLYRRYVADATEKKLERTRNALRALVEEIGGSVSHATGEVSRYEASLAGYSETLKGEVSSAELRHVVARLSDETRSVRETGTRLQERLEESRKETEALRKELEQARLEATTDALTGLANRKAFFRGLEQMQTAASGDRTELCLLLIDIDHFKTINDTYGHLLGDKIIRFIGNIMKDLVKGKDLVARYGGEEFAVLLPDTPYDGACAVAEAIRAAVESGRLIRSDTKQAIGIVTVSIGVAVYRPDESPDSFIGRADEALYRSKQTGRNRIIGETELLATAV